MKWLFFIAASAAGAMSLFPATAFQVPTALRVGNQSLPAASCATRDTLWIHHYAAALYVPPRESPASTLRDPREPKALQVQILSKTFLPKEMPKKWRQTLDQQLDDGSADAVRNAWRELSVGDRVTVAYVPGPGLSLQLNDRIVARTARHQLIEALLETWAEGEPIAERLSRVISRHPCQH